MTVRVAPLAPWPESAGVSASHNLHEQERTALPILAIRHVGAQGATNPNRPPNEVLVDLLQMPGESLYFVEIFL